MNPADHNLQPLSIPVPPALLAALDYPGEQRFFTMSWSEAGEDYPVSLGYWDGFYGHSRPMDAYLLYTSHPSVAPHLAGYELGTDPESAEHLLVFDRDERVAWIGTVANVHRFLRDQWPPLSREEVTAVAFSKIDELLTAALRDTEMSLHESAKDRRQKAEAEQQRQATLLNALQQALDEAAAPS